MMPGGRPSSYTAEIADAICERLVMGQSLNSICQSDDMPALSTVYKWLRERNEFSENYARAREDQADTYAEEIIDIADDSGGDAVIEMRDGKPFAVFDGEAVQRARLRVDSRKWVAAKLKPRTYGDKLDTHHTGNVNLIVETGIERGDGGA